MYLLLKELLRCDQHDAVGVRMRDRKEPTSSLAAAAAAAAAAAVEKGASVTRTRWAANKKRDFACRLWL